MTTQPTVSVIIPTYNEAGYITACLNSLKKQIYKPLEIIIVDDGSTDKTIKLVKKFSAIKLLKQSHLGPGLARNKGAKKARGKILVFVDADMTFDNRFISQLVKPIITGKSKGTFTKDEFVANWDQLLARFWNYQQGITTHRRLPENYPSKAPVFRAILKSEFDHVGGFDPIGYTDDWSLSAKLNYKADTAPNAICYHHNPDTLEEIWRQASWIGKRRYKLGFTGKLIALTRSSLLVSIVIATLKSIRFKTPLFFSFKLYYDLAIFFAIIQSLVTRKNVK